MKNKFTKLFLILTLFTALFSGCSNLVAHDTNENAGCTLSVRLNEQNSRTAMPEVSANMFTDLYMIITSPANKEYYKICGPWKTYKEFSESKIPMNKGTYDIWIFGICETLGYEATKRFTIQDGENILGADLLLSYDFGDGTGTGGVNISVKYPASDVKKITACLYDVSSANVPGFNVKDVSAKGGQTSYTASDIPVGNYVVEFKFYGDDSKTVLLGTCREAACVAKNLVSVSSVELTSFSKIYSIRYENLGVEGGFANGQKYPVSYTHHSGILELPIPSPRTKSIYFAGWYTEENYSGSPVTSFNAMECQDKVFYAKWLPKKTVTYNANGGKFRMLVDGVKKDITSYTEYVEENSNYTLRAVSDLSLISSDDKTFVGWSTSSNSQEIKYYDATTHIIKDNENLYAVYAKPIPEDQDSDQDGLTDLYEIANHLDPNNRDTDGDGWTDKEEVNMYNSSKKIFDPRIADLPSIQVDMIGHPSIKYNYTVTNGSSSSASFNTTEGTTNSSSNSTSHGETSSHTHGWKIGFNQKVNLTKWNVELGFSEEGSGSYTGGSSYTYSSSQSQGYSHSITNGKVFSENESRTIQGGSLSAQIKVTNTGNISYRLKNLVITFNRIAPGLAKTIIPVGSSEPAIQGDITLAPGESHIFTVSKNFNGKDTIETLIKNSNGIYLNVSGWSATCGDGVNMKENDFTNAITNVNAKCARISIDYGVESGSMKQEIYRVSAKTNYNSSATSIDKAYSPVSLHDMLKTIGLKTQSDLDAEGDTSSPPSLCLDANGKIKSIRNVESKGNHTAGDWYILITREKANSVEKIMYNDFENETDTEKTLSSSSTYNLVSKHSYNLDDIMIYPQDNINIFYDRDEDNDGVSLSEEELFGTSDQKKDTDGDGLSDFDEIYGFYVAGNKDKLFCTNPILKDSDGDDLDDNVDQNPLEPLLKSDPIMEKISYRVKSSNEIKNVTSFTKVDGKTNCYTVDLGKEDLSDSFIGSVTPKYLGSAVEYSFAYKMGSFEDDFKPLDDEPIVLPHSTGEKSDSQPKFVIRITAPDGETMGYYYCSYVSDYAQLQSYDVVSNADGAATLTWKNYNDPRFEGYIIHGVTVNSLDEKYTPLKLTKTLIKSADEGTNFSGSNVYISVGQSELKSGSVSVQGLVNHKMMTFAFYGYENSDSSTVVAKLLGTKTIKLQHPTKGTLKFFAHYIEAVEDHDGGYDPEYNWTFGSSNFNLSDLNASRGSIPDFDDDDDRFYNFETRSMAKANQRPPISYTREYSCTFERLSNKTCTITWDATEEDSGPDDYLGRRTLTMKYNKDTDEWKCNLDGTPYKDSPKEFTLSAFTENKVCTNFYLNSGDGQVAMWFTVQWCWQ